VADNANRRWVVFERDDPSSATSRWNSTEVPWTDVYGVTAQPVIDEAGLVYAVVYGPLGDGGTNAFELRVYDSNRSLADPIDRHSLGVFGNAGIALLPSGVFVGSRQIDGLVPTITERATLTIGDSNRIRLRSEGVDTVFLYGTVLQPILFGPMPGLEDGTGLVFVPVDGVETVDRIGSDGAVTRVALRSSVSVFGSAFVTEDGFLRLEVSPDGSTWEIARYELPGS
jgi:hypothetical protein